MKDRIEAGPFVIEPQEDGRHKASAPVRFLARDGVRQIRDQGGFTTTIKRDPKTGWWDWYWWFDQADDA